MIKSVVIGLAALAAQSQVSPQPDPLKTLAETSPEIAASEAEAEAAIIEVKVARAAWMPQLRLEAQAGAQEQTLSLPTPDGVLSLEQSLNPRNARAVLDQLVYSSGVASGAIGAAKANAEAAEASRQSVHEEIMLNGAIAISDVVRDTAIVSVRRQNERVIEGRLIEVEARKANGLATETDLRQSQSRLAAARASRIAAEGALARTRASYVRLFGEVPPDTLDFPALPSALPAQFEDAEQIAASESPNIQSAQSQVRAARFRVKESRGRTLPQVRLSAEAAYADDIQIAEFLGEAERYGVFLNVSMDLFAGGANRSRLKAAKRRVAAAEQSLESTRRQTREALVAAWSDLEISEAVVAARSEQVRAAEAALDGVRRENEVGRRTRLDLLDADLELANARVDQVTAERDQIVAAFRILFVLGQL